MIKFLTTDQTLDLRSSGLREGLNRSLCGFEGDDEEDSFHVGYFRDGMAVGIATFHKQLKEGFSGTGFQLRGMVTHHDFQKEGIGNQLLNFSIVYLKGKQIDYIWCNARKTAYKFYERIGFEYISDEFELPKIGPHKVMFLKIN